MPHKINGSKNLDQVNFLFFLSWLPQIWSHLSLLHRGCDFLRKLYSFPGVSKYRAHDVTRLYNYQLLNPPPCFTPQPPQSPGSSNSNVDSTSSRTTGPLNPGKSPSCTELESLLCELLAFHWNAFLVIFCVSRRRAQEKFFWDFLWLEMHLFCLITCHFDWWKILYLKSSPSSLKVFVYCFLTTVLAMRSLILIRHIPILCGRTVAAWFCSLWSFRNFPLYLVAYILMRLCLAIGFFPFILVSIHGPFQRKDSIFFLTRGNLALSFLISPPLFFLISLLW